ncbi:biotin transporter BioY [Tepidibacter formicigenes]|jgi:biotin transport system substrate-specific component|uniref:Biotin transporter n=1 Tax=Tepidibacter formicigenes DSM 15518 TaxID=1123349 RepID=A0A1M6U0E0_9FIRM|nr:biotin transporter BioY [Tepidibacter formicigenes]SHK62649.1 biotin transport system substrate-specific component [Tepidibacter formicigenes DSM 15518]
MNTKNLVLSSLFAAITAIASQISIPIQPVPITFQVLAVALAGALLGKKYGFISQIVFLLIGAIGIPVFAGFKGGFNVIVGPTGGYLLAYPIATYIIGYFSEKKGIINISIGMLFGLIVIYLTGMIQLKFILNLSLKKAFMAGVAPFVILDLIKLVIASFVVDTILKRTNTFQNA